MDQEFKYFFYSFMYISFFVYNFSESQKGGFMEQIKKNRRVIFKLWESEVWATPSQNFKIKALILESTKATNKELQGKKLKTSKFEFFFSMNHKSGIYYGVPKRVALELIRDIKKGIEVL